MYRTLITDGWEKINNRELRTKHNFKSKSWITRQKKRERKAQPWREYISPNSESGFRKFQNKSHKNDKILGNFIIHSLV